MFPDKFDEYILAMNFSFILEIINAVKNVVCWLTEYVLQYFQKKSEQNKKTIAKLKRQKHHKLVLIYF